jgi:hypothetical protein
MKHLLKIVSLVAVLVCILVSNAFACNDLLSQPIVASSYAYCLIRNIDDKKQIDGAIEVCKSGSPCAAPVPFTLNPGEVTSTSLTDGSGVYYCNFEVSKRKKVSASICSDLGCMAVPRK